MLRKKFTSISVCTLCGGSTENVYFLNNYEITWCGGCGTSRVAQLPTDRFLEDFYQGFQYQTNPAALDYIRTEAMRQWMTGMLVGKKHFKMLDFGGGGGLFAKAFEDFRLGHAYYVDLDREACRFASSVLGLKSVFRTFDEVQSELPTGGFDLILCRHVIEHVTDPVKLVLNLGDLLSERGTLVVSCPNGASKEGLFYPSRWKMYLAPIARDNGWSKMRAVAFSLTRKYGWGISPPRHLWALTAKGIRTPVERSGQFAASVESASLANKVYSPYWHSAGFLGSLRDQICDSIFGSYAEGMHLVLKIERKRS